jgi:hypothetical protein
MHADVASRESVYREGAGLCQSRGTPCRRVQTTERDPTRHCTQNQCNRCLVELGPVQSRRRLPAEELHTRALAQPEPALQEPAGRAPRQRPMEQVRGAALEQQQPARGSQWDARGHGPVQDQQLTKTHNGARTVAKFSLTRPVQANHHSRPCL